MSWLQWQLARESARSYDKVMVPAVLMPAARELVARLAPADGDAVLDAGCGSGTVCRLVGDAVGPTGRVVGVDVNENMLEVARKVCPLGHFEVGDVRELKAQDGAFDVVYAAHLVQFVAERALAVGELARVTRAGGRVGVTTWAPFPANPYFAAVHDALARTLGDEVAAPLGVACSLGESGDAWTLLHGAGLVDVRVEEHAFTAELGALETFVPHHLLSTPMSGVVRGAGDEAMAEMVGRVVRRLDAQHSGAVRVRFSQLVATATRV